MVSDFQISGTVFSPRDALEVIFRRKRPILVLYITTVVACLLYVFFWPPTYRATVRFLIKNSRQETTISGDINAIRTSARQPVTEDDLNSEAAILLSNSVIENTVQQAAIDKMPEHWAVRALRVPINTVRGLYDRYHGKPDPTPMGRAVKRLAQKASVEVEKRSNVLTLNVDWGDPRVATTIAETLASNYLAQHLEVRKNPPALGDFFRDQVAGKEAELRTIEEQIESVRPAGSIDALSYERNKYQDSVTSFEQNWRNDRADGARWTARLQAEQHALSTTPATVVASERAVVNEQAISSLRLQVVELERKNVELLRKFTPDNRLVRQNQQELQIAREALVKALESPATERTTGANPVAQAVLTDSAADAISMAGITAHAKALKAEQSAIDDKMRKLSGDWLRMRQLERERRAAEDSFLTYARRYEENRIDDALDENRFSNVALIEPVRASDTPIKPAAKLLMELALSLGLLVAIGFGFLLEVLDHRVKSSIDGAALPVPLLATFRIYPYLSTTPRRSAVASDRSTACKS